MTDLPLTSGQVAELLGIARSTWTTYVSTGRSPQPDAVIGRSPVWHRTTIETWQAQRRGQGWRARTKRDHPEGEA